jgi:hypothetical protein
MISLFTVFGLKKSQYKDSPLKGPLTSDYDILTCLQKITFDMKVSISLKGMELKNRPTMEYMNDFLKHMPKNKIKEVCFKNGHGDGMLNENFVMKLGQIFPCMEKLVIEPKIDSWDRDGGRCVIMPKCLVITYSIIINYIYLSMYVLATNGCLACTSEVAESII